MSVIDLHGFGWRHAGRRAWALRDVDLRVAPGERVLLLGPSGAGKSTLLAAIAGLLAADSGEQEGTRTIDARVGLLGQDPESQLVMARAGDDVAFGLENLGTPATEIWPRVDAAMTTVAFPYGRSHRTEALSGGEQQRLALAGALAPRPGVLLLDEPTANLDPGNAALVRDAVDRALTATGAAMVLVEHRVAEWLPLIDRVVVLSPTGAIGCGGGVVADGAPTTVFADHAAALTEAGVWLPDQHVPPRRANTPPGDVLLTGHGLGFTHPGANRPALSDVDIEVRANRVLAVTGASGVGKSTLALLLGGLVAPTHGLVRPGQALAGRDAQGPPHRWRAAALAARIGSVFQNPEHQFLRTRVFDELALGPRRAGRSPAETKSIVDNLLVRLRLDALALANPYTLSGGEQRRLSVATALATAPQVLILDEPTFGQDRRTWTELIDLLADLRTEGRAIVTVTHDTQFVETLADATIPLSTPQPLPVT